MQEKYDKEMSVQKGLPVKVLIAAAGSSERYGTDIPKQYQKINGKTVLRHTIEKFLKVPDIDDIRVIINPSDADLYHDAVQGLNLPPYIEGSNSRKNSVYNGLKSFSDVKNNFKILIHDAARPLVSPEDIQVVIDTLDHNQAATLGRKVPDTLRKSNYAALDRDNTWLIQTPQGFSYQDIWKAHETFKDRDDFTDDASLIAEMGGQVHILQSTSPTFKITIQNDLIMAHDLLEQNFETRTGYGFDVHAFDNDAADHVRLCGIDIPHSQKLKGHSDADVVLHAITDALLGAIGQGDIGQHFPPSDDQWKGKDSAYFLEQAIEMLERQSAAIINIDVTIICEAPKIVPHREAMIERLHGITKVEQSRINIKATTTEQLGFTGRKEGIATQAIANVRLPVSQ